MTAHSPAPTTPSLRSKLDVLHDQYAEAINYAVTEGDDARVAELAAGYDDEATRLVAEHEGKTDLLDLVPTFGQRPRRRRSWRRSSQDGGKATA